DLLSRRYSECDAGIRGNKRTFIAEKQERFILTNGSANRPAELLALRRGLKARGEEVLRVETRVTVEHEAGTVPVIGAGFCRQLNLPAGPSSEFGWREPGLNPKLTNRVLRRPHRRLARRPVVVVGAVE